MGRGLGPRQEEALQILDVRGRSTVAELADALNLQERRCREVVRTLVARGSVATTREQVGVQATSGLPVHGTVVWTHRALFRRDADRWSAAHYATHRALIERDVRALREELQRCPHCGESLSVPPGDSDGKSPGGSFAVGADSSPSRPGGDING